MIASLLDMKGLASARAEVKPAPNRRLPHPAGRVDLPAPNAPFHAVELSPEQIEGCTGEWRHLATRALEPNAFYAPAFAISAARHFPASERPRLIAVRDNADRLMGLFPMGARGPLFGDGLIRLWLHKQAALATPLVDRDQALEAIDAFLDWVDVHGKCAGVVFSRIPTNGLFHEALKRAACSTRRRIETLYAYERATLLPGADASVEELSARAGAKKKLAEIRRQERRLGEMGRLTFETHESEDEIKSATEEFLALEASGWKAGRGAFLSEPALATFLRSATRLLARENGCKIEALRLDGRAIAMGLILKSQDRRYFWKIAFDESLRSQAPGVQLVYQHTKALLGRADLEMVDSCAIANHPMIDRLWPDRIAICDVAVSLRAARQNDFSVSCRRAKARREVRELVKRAANRLLRRKVS